MHNLTAHHLNAQRLQRRALGTALVGAALLLASCDVTVKPPTPVPNPNIISGQISPWTAGWANSVHPVNGAIENPGTAFTAKVNSSGQFDLNLPNSATMNSTYGDDLMKFNDSFASCAKFQSNAPAGMKIAQINELITDKNKSISASSNGGVNFMLWWYVTQGATVTMTGSDCVFGSTNSTLALKQGWNVVKQAITSSGGKNVSTYTVITAPTQRVTWKATDATLASQGLSSNILRPWVKANTSTQ